MSTRQDQIVDYLSHAFVTDKAVDPVEVAHALQQRFPGVPVTELAESVRLVANGIGVRLKEAPRVKANAETHTGAGV
jgi:hypothetical protein